MIRGDRYVVLEGRGRIDLQKDAVAGTEGRHAGAVMMDAGWQRAVVSERQSHRVAGRVIDRAWSRGAVPIVLLVLASGGCANLTAIQQFAALSAQTVGYRQLVQDYVTAPERLARYAPRSGVPKGGEEAAQRRAQESGLVELQATLEAYMDALGRLAADETVGYAAEFTDLSSAIAGAHFATAAQAGAATNLAELLTRAATDGWRRRRLAAVIGDANAPVQDLIGGLRTIARAFALDLQTEQLAAESYFQTLLRSSRDRAALAALREWKDVHDERLVERRARLAAYEDALTQIAAGHQALFDDRTRLASADTLARIERYARELRVSYRMLREAR
jgi:hypothetical protein